MKVVKNINNNVSLCIDSQGREVIAFGKGIGFIKPPHEVPLSKIDRTFYSQGKADYEGIQNIPETVLRIAIKIIDEAQQILNVTMMSTAALALADHINFAIQRLHEHILLELPIQEDIKQLYPKEMQMAYRALEIIKTELNVILDRKEAGTIALHFINNRIAEHTNEQQISTNLMMECIAIIEKEYQIKINQDSFNYSRFVTHVDYLIRRTFEDRQIESTNMQMYHTLKKQYPTTYICVAEINEIFRSQLHITLNDEEKLYLMLHINRLCVREQITQ